MSAVGIVCTVVLNTVAGRRECVAECYGSFMTAGRDG